VPAPSLAKTEPEENVRVACPWALALKLMVIIFPLAPVNPGFITMPSKFIVPALLEKFGSCTHKLKIEPLFEREITSNLSEGKEITPPTAFMAWSELETKTLTENVLPT